MSFLDPAFMQRALLAALLIGITAPSVGIYLVQRRQAFMGDGIGHVALTGVGLGFLMSTSPVYTAVVTAAVGAAVMELIRERNRISGDVALSVMFYGGIAGGVMLINLAPDGGSSKLQSYLFGSLTSVTEEDIRIITVLSVAVVAVMFGMRRALFTVCQDEEFARLTGLPVRAVNLTLAVTAAVTVTVAMRVVGLLLVSALMVVPVAVAQQVTRTFAPTAALAVAVGVLVSVSGTIMTYYVDVPPGATIVLLAIGLFILTTLVATPFRRARGRRARLRNEITPGGDDVAVDGPAPRSPDAGTMSST